MNAEDVANILATGDVYDSITERSDTFTVEEGVALYDALAAARAKLSLAMSMIDTQLKNTLESPRQFNGKVYYRKPDGKWRPDHTTLRQRVVRAASSDDHGELRHAVDAAEQAVDMMYALFVANTTMPKTGGLDRLHLDKTDIAHWERTGFRVVVDDMKEPE